MKFKSALLTQASGSVGGVTFYQSRAGLTARARTVPVDTASDRQMAMRGFITSLVAAWVGTLTPTQRDGWALYASNVPIIGPLGDPRILPPIAHYVRSNASRLQVGLARIDNAPTTFDLGDPVQVTDATLDVGVGAELDVSVVPGPATSRALVYVGRPQNPGVQWFRGPFRFTADEVGNETNVTQALAEVPFTFAEGQSLFIRTRRTNDDGRLSGIFDFGPVTVVSTGP